MLSIEKLKEKLEKIKIKEPHDYYLFSKEAEKFLINNNILFFKTKYNLDVFYKGFLVQIYCY